MSPNKHGIDTKWNSSGFIALVSGIRQDSDENVKCLKNKKCGRGQQWLGLLLFFSPSKLGTSLFDSKYSPGLCDSKRRYFYWSMTKTLITILLKQWWIVYFPKYLLYSVSFYSNISDHMYSCLKILLLSWEQSYLSDIEIIIIFLFDCTIDLYHGVQKQKKGKRSVVKNSIENTH